MEGIRPYHPSCRSTNSFLRRYYRIEVSSARLAEYLRTTFGVVWVE